MTRHAKLLTVLGAALLVAAGIGAPIYYYTVHAPEQRRGQMQTDIDRWGRSWARAKSCLLAGGQANIDQALLVHELHAGETAFDSCREHVGGLLDQPSSATGIRSVDVAWRDLETWVRQFDKVFQGGHRSADTRAVSAFAPPARAGRATDQGPGDQVRHDSPGEQRRKIAEKIRDLDRHYAELRRAAGLQRARPEAARPAVPALPPGSVIGEATDLRVLERVGDAVTVRIARSDHDEVLVIRASGVDRYPIGGGIVRALGGHWGLFVDEEEGALRAAALDATGYPQDDGALIARDESLSILEAELAIGAADDRIAVFSTDAGTHLATSSDGGAEWQPPSPLPLSWLEASWARGIAHAFHHWNGVLVWMPMTPRTFGSTRTELRREPSSTDRPVTCFAPSILWMLTTDELTRVDHDGRTGSRRMGWPPPPSRWETEDSVACHDDGVAYVVARGDRARLTACSMGDDCTTSEFEYDLDGGSRFFVTFGLDSALVANVVEDVLIVWKQNAGAARLTPVTMHALPDDATLLGLIADGPFVHVLLHDVGSGTLEQIPVAVP